MTFREFTGKNVEEAIRAAMREFEADLGDLDIEILSQGSRGILGVGGEEARILAAPKSAVAAAETVRVEADVPPDDEAQLEVGEAEAAEATGPVALEDEDLAGDQVAELARAETVRHRERGERGGRGRGVRPSRGRDGRERERGEHAVREARAEPSDRPAREPAPFVPAK